MRDEILRKTREEPIKCEQNEIVVLKQIPWRVREVRKQYQFLTSKLNEKKINFRWLTLEGILIMWQGTRFRLDSTDKGREFYEKYISDREEELHEGAVGEGPNKRRETTVEEREEQGERENLDEKTYQELTVRKKRNTRINPKYK